MVMTMDLFGSNGLYVNPGYDNFDKFQTQDYYVDKVPDTVKVSKKLLPNKLSKEYLEYSFGL